MCDPFAEAARPQRRRLLGRRVPDVAAVGSPDTAAARRDGSGFTVELDGCLGCRRELSPCSPTDGACGDVYSFRCRSERYATPRCCREDTPPTTGQPGGCWTENGTALTASICAAPPIRAGRLLTIAQGPASPLCISCARRRILVERSGNRRIRPGIGASKSLQRSAAFLNFRRCRTASVVTERAAPARAQRRAGMLARQQRAP